MSPVTLVFASRLISQRSLPFWTTIIESFTSRTGPVTSYVFAPAKATLLKARLAAANKLSADFVFMCRLDSLRLFLFKRFCNSDSERSEAKREKRTARSCSARGYTPYWARRRRRLPIQSSLLDLRLFGLLGSRCRCRACS